MRGWKEDKKWTDGLLPHVKCVLGAHLIGEAPEEEDQEHNTDLIVLTLKPVRVACRIRTYEYLDKYEGEFTIRSGRPSGIKTELTKVVEGWGDYFFYGFANEHKTELVAWVLGDLKVFRGWFNRKLFCLTPGKTPGQEFTNADKSSSFHVFKLKDLPTEFIVARKRKTESQQRELQLAAGA
jgi:hypothetical protein